jgi:hypothetical protein
MESIAVLAGKNVVRFNPPGEITGIGRLVTENGDFAMMAPIPNMGLVVVAGKKQGALRGKLHRQGMSICNLLAKKFSPGLHIVDYHIPLPIDGGDQHFVRVEGNFVDCVRNRPEHGHMNDVERPGRIHIEEKYPMRAGDGDHLIIGRNGKVR